MDLKYIIRTNIKKILSIIIPNSEKLRYLFYLPKLREQKFKNKKIKSFKNRFKLYDYMNEQIFNNSKITFLEFGVFEGESINYWCELNSNQESRFIGFDTFEGLPESWQQFSMTLNKATFDTHGKIPEINDKRVSFHKGLYQHTLEDYLKNLDINGQLIIHMDADLYSSTLFVLCKLDNFIKVGTIILFDEFSSVLHESRALEDYVVSHSRDYEVLCSTNLDPESYFNEIAIQITK